MQDRDRRFQSSMSMMGDYQQMRCDTNYVYCEWSDHRNGRHYWSHIGAARRPLPALAGAAEKPGSGVRQQSRFVLEQNRPSPVANGTMISRELGSSQTALLAIRRTACRPLSRAGVRPPRDFWRSTARDWPLTVSTGPAVHYGEPRGFAGSVLVA